MYHTWQVPFPAPSKSTTLGIGGSPAIVPSSSVMTHPLLVLLPPVTVIEPAGIISATPSPTQYSKGPPARVAASAVH